MTSHRENAELAARVRKLEEQVDALSRGTRISFPIKSKPRRRNPGPPTNQSLRLFRTLFGMIGPIAITAVWFGCAFIVVLLLTGAKSTDFVTLGLVSFLLLVVGLVIVDSWANFASVIHRLWIADPHQDKAAAAFRSMSWADAIAEIDLSPM